MSHSPCAAATLARDEDFARFKEYVIDMTGLAYYRDRDEELIHRVRGRMECLGLGTFGDYLERLSDGAFAEEPDRLIEQLTIGETHFFRHQEMFAALRDVVAPSMFAENRGPHLRIWSAACANGAEAHSVSITLQREVGYDRSRFEVTILGTEINRESLRRARLGEYSNWDLRGTSDELREACFTRRSKTWTILPEYRQGVEFQYHNLVRHPFPSLANNLVAFDLILCRNVLMYFDRTTVARLARQLYDTLVEGGWLLVGHADPSPDLFDQFQTVMVPGAVLYRKVSGERGAPAARSQACVAPARHEWIGANAGIPRKASRPRKTTRTHSPRRGATQPVADRAGQRTDFHRRVRELADRGALNDAVQVCRTWINEASMDAVPYLYLALLLDQQGGRSEAASLLKKALYLDPRLVVAHYHTGLALQRLGKLDQARRAFENTRQLLRDDDGGPVPHADGLTARDLRELIDVQLCTGNTMQECANGD